MTTNINSAGGTPSRLLLAAFAVCLATGATGAFNAADATQAAVSKAELRQFCARFDMPFWIKGPRYGCGERIQCVHGHCRGNYAFLLNREMNGEGGHGGNGANGRR